MCCVTVDVCGIAYTVAACMSQRVEGCGLCEVHMGCQSHYVSDISHVQSVCSYGCMHDLLALHGQMNRD